MVVKLLKMRDEKQEILELLKVYRSLPALWDIKCEEYSDRSVKAVQYKILFECYKKYNPSGQLSDLKKKINLLRTNFRRELRRRDRLEKRNEAGEDVSFQTTLYYFDAISFLEDTVAARASIINVKREGEPKPRKQKIETVEETDPETDGPFEETEDEKHQLSKVWTEKPYALEATQRIFTEKREGQPKPRKRKIEIAEETDLETDGPFKETEDEKHHLSKVWTERPSALEATQRIFTEKRKAEPKPRKRKIETVEQQYIEIDDPLEEIEDRNHHLAKVWAEKLSTMDSTQKIFAEKVINDVFLNGQLGLLTLTTTLIQSPKQEPLNKYQFVQAFKYFMQNDDEFVQNLHDAYLNIAHSNITIKRYCK